MLINSLPQAIKNRVQQLEMPVLYREAVKALEKCTTMDEAKYYSEKSDALAAWAKIYGSDEDSKAAARLKLRAYARMGQLAGELQPVPSRKGIPPNQKGDGPQRLLMRHGLTINGAQAARRLGKLPEKEMEKLMENPISPSAASKRFSYSKLSTTWKLFAERSDSPYHMIGFCRKHDPQQLAIQLTSDEIPKALGMIRELSEWLDSFAQCVESRSSEAEPGAVS